MRKAAKTAGVTLPANKEVEQQSEEVDSRGYYNGGLKNEKRASK